jgi:hypothetical protein
MRAAASLAVRPFIISSRARRNLSDDRLATATRPRAFSSLEPGECALADQITLELAEYAEQVEDRPVAGPQLCPLSVSSPGFPGSLLSAIKGSIHGHTGRDGMARRRLLSDTAWERLLGPATEERDMVRHYTLSSDDLALAGTKRTEATQLGFAPFGIRAGFSPPARRRLLRWSRLSRASLA